MNEKTYHGGIERLRDPARIALLEIDRVVTESLDGLEINSMLDVGTGSGIFAEAFAKTGITVSGVDMKEEMLEAARSFVPAGTFNLGEMEKLPNANGSVDLVFLGHVIHEADDLFVALSEAKRVARKRVVILEWPYKSEEKGPPIDHRLKPEDIEIAARKAGFAKTTVIHLNRMELFVLDML